jgi:hypothetical protein
VRHARLEHVRVGTVLEGERDERGPHVVVPAMAEFERREVLSRQRFPE